MRLMRFALCGKQTGKVILMELENSSRDSSRTLTDDMRGIDIYNVRMVMFGKGSAMTANPHPEKRLPKAS